MTPTDAGWYSLPVMARALQLSLLVLTLTACKDPTSEKLMDALDDYDYERDGTREVLCTCPSALGYATEDECKEGLGDIGSAEKSCIVDVFDGREQLGVDYFQCLAPIQRSFEDCLLDFFGCGPDWYVTCQQARDMEALDTCPTLPADVAEAYLSCI